MSPAPLITLLAAALTASAADPAPTLRAELMAAASRARTAFLAGNPVNGAVPEAELSRIEALPELRQAEGKKWDGVSALESYKEFTAALAEAARVQEQGLSPEGPQGPERLNMKLLASLQLTPVEVAQSEARYRRPSAEKTSPADRQRLEAERARLEAAMANPRLPAAERSRLGSRMNRIAAQLRWDPGEPGGDAVLASMGPGTGGALNAADFQRLNAANATPGPHTLSSRAVPMPGGPGVSAFTERARRAATRADQAHLAQEQRRQRVLSEADRESQNVEGIASDAYRYWDSMDKGAGGWLSRGTAKTMKGLLTLSGLTAVERSAARAGYLSGSDDVTGWDQTKGNAAMVGNMGLSALNFLPAAGMTSRLVNGERAVTWLSRGGAAARGVEAAAPTAATAITRVGGEVGQAAKASFTAGAKPTTAQLEGYIARLNQTGRAYGVEVRVGGVVGESQAAGGVVTASLAKGGSHEVVHVTQQVMNDISALERAAAKAGVPVAGLSTEARAAAFAEARRLEQAAYLQHEAQAFHATGFGGGGRATYVESLGNSVRDLTVSNIQGTVLAGGYGKAATAYGATGALLGDSQKLLFTNGYWASANILYPTLNAATNSGLEYLMDLGTPAPPAPAPRPRRK